MRGGHWRPRIIFREGIKAATREDIMKAWRRQPFSTRWIGTASVAATAILLLHSPADAQRRNDRPAAMPAQSEWIDCLPLQQPLIQIPEIVSQNGVLRGTVLLTDETQRRFSFTGTPPRCAPQRVRYFEGVNAIPAQYPGVPPQPPVAGIADPVPGPTLRARVGDIVKLTFLNQVDPNHYGDSIDRGERGQGCDETSVYPGNPAQGGDVFPDCFHGSTTGNIHFHGTHTNPTSTGDNVFIEVRPSLRERGRAIVTEASVKPAFDDFFALCEAHLRNNNLSQWPRQWRDLPLPWRASQEALLKAYDSNPAIVNKLWPVNARQIREGAWPQYYIGAYPYCFTLPRYVPPPPAQAVHAAHVARAAQGLPEDDARTLRMGQAPGTHWYHAHKHGSTTINVANGMTGAFIIEGPYDDAFNRFYGSGWSRRQPVLVINQLGTTPNLERGTFGHQNLSVNGRMQPKLTMQPGEVQLWRIANTASRSGTFLVGFSATANPDPNSAGFTWKQVAQDGVQFNGINYQNSNNPQLLIAPGNRVDLLVKAPANAGAGPFALLIQQARSFCETLSPTLPASQLPQVPTTPPTAACTPEPQAPLLYVEVSGSPASGNQATFIPQDQFNASFPAFLGDIADGEVKATKTVVFESLPGIGNGPVMHTIDGNKFDGNIGQVVLLNTVEEWRIVNRTVRAPAPGGGTTDPPGIVDHPFHIHINPFQITEVFDPNQMIPGPSGALIPKYIFEGQAQTGQCRLNINDPATWKPCDAAPQSNRIWWDVFPIPSARAVLDPTPGGPLPVIVPGYFKMRSRFVDYSGQYVTHCHILAHEDRGMMTIVQVVPFKTPYSHK
jgi:FtsP/CotA-like multicopper oxidase with cupredoxin domain